MVLKFLELPFPALRNFRTVTPAAGLLRGAACMAALLLAAATARAAPATGLRAIDDPAITVKAPDKVALIAVTRAGHRLVAVGEHGVIAYSDDDGMSWRQALVPVDVTLTCVQFATPLVGWAAGHFGVILHTVDGGRSWQLQLTGTQVNLLISAAADAALAQAPGANAAEKAVRRARFFIAAGADKPFLSIWASDPRHAIIFGAYRMAMETENGGETWRDWSLRVQDTLSHHLYDAVVENGDIFLVGELGLVFRSTDRGSSFPQVTPPSGTTLFGAVPTGGNGLLAYGVAGQAFRTDDGGQSWVPLQFGDGTNLTAGCALASGAILVASEDGALYLSNDHAHGFQRLPRVLPLAVYGLAQADDGDLVAVGDSGAMLLPARIFVAAAP